MTREFLQNLMPQPLPKEILDAIMAENGRDIQKAKAAFADFEELKTRLAEAEGKLQQQTQQEDWKGKYEQALEEHAAALRQVSFDRHLDKALWQMRGRNSKAICALLDIASLQAQEDQPQAIRQALEELQQEHGYLFASASPPPYAPNTGAEGPKDARTPASLAGALREKFERK